MPPIVARDPVASIQIGGRARVEHRLGRDLVDAIDSRGDQSSTDVAHKFAFESLR
jgi:hypothetical protein